MAIEPSNTGNDNNNNNNNNNNNAVILTAQTNKGIRSAFRGHP